MGWDRGRYYTRSTKVDGRVVREYVGSGRVAELAAQLDAIAREKREQERAEWKALREQVATFDAPLDELHQLVEMVAHAALRVAGFHRHKRGEWRKRRVPSKEAGPDEGRTR